MRMRHQSTAFLAITLLASIIDIGVSAQIAQKTKSLEQNNATYTLYLDDKTATLTLYNGTQSTDCFDIPETVKDDGTEYSVTVIGSAAFSLSTGAKKIKIPKSVVKIEDNAFYPMYGSMLIEEFEVDVDNPSYKSDNGILLDKEGAVLIQVPTLKSGELAIPSTVTAIGWGAVVACSNLTSVKIPEGVTSIGAYAFQWCTRLASVELPSTLVSMGDYAFNNCNTLNSITARMLHPFRLTGQNAKDLTSKIVYIPKCYTSEYATYWGLGNTYTDKTVQATAENMVVTLATSSYTYDGTERKPAVSLTVDGGVVATEEYNVAYANNKAAGTATVTITDALVGCGNFELVEKHTEFTIAQKEATVEWGTTTFTYDGTPKAARATVAGLVEGDTCSVAAYEGQHRETNAGTYKATAKSLTNSNYKLPANAETQWTIGRKSVTPTVVMPDYDKTFDGTAKSPMPTLRDGDAIIPQSEYEVSYANNVNAGTATMTVKSTTGGNYDFSDLSQTFEVAKRELTPAWAQTQFVFDGTPRTVAATLSNVVAAHPCTPTAYEGNVQTDAGTYTATVTAISDQANYVLAANASTAWSITPRPLATGEFSIVVAQEAMVYNGSPHTPEVAVTFGGQTLPASEYNVEWRDNVHAGIATVVVKNQDGGNYALAEKTATFQIVPRRLTLSSASQSWTYDGEAHSAATVTVAEGELVATDAFAYAGFPSVTNVGQVANVFTVAAAEGSATRMADYSLTTVPGALVVTPLPVSGYSVEVSPESYVYDGTPRRPEVRVRFAGVDLAPTAYTVSYEDNVRVGTATVRIADSGAANWQVADGTAQFSIVPLSLSVEGTVVADKVYDGTTAATVPVLGTLVGAASSDDVSLASASASFADPDAGSGKAVAVSYALSGGDADNYRLGGATLTASIAKAQQVAPAVSGRGTSDRGVDDGRFVGVTTLMEFRRQGETAYAPVANPDAPLAAGTYYVRLAETGNLLPSPDTEVQIAQGGKLLRSIGDYSVAMPANTNFDGQAKVATVSGPGEITVLYSSDNAVEWTSVAPVNVGRYEVMFTVAEDEGHHAASFTSPAWVFSVVHDVPAAADFVPASGGYCVGESGSVAFRVAAGAPTEFRAVVAADAASLSQAEYAALDGSGAFSFSLPKMGDGEATLWVQFRDVFGFESEVYSLSITVNLSSDYMTDIWSDVVSIVNKVDLDDPANLTPRFQSYQWYRDGEPIAMATKPYYQQPGGLSGTYHVRVVTTSGETLTTCPKTWAAGQAKALSLRVFPNPVSGSVHVELSTDDGETHTLTVVDNKGVVVGRDSFTGAEAQFDMSALNPGLYIVVVDNLNANVVKK